MKQSKRIIFRCDDTTYSILEEYAKKHGCSSSSVIRNLINTLVLAQSDASKSTEEKDTTKVYVPSDTTAKSTPRPKQLHQPESKDLQPPPKKVLTAEEKEANRIKYQMKLK